MAKYGSASVAFFLVDGLNLLGYSTDLSDGKEALTEDVQALGDIWPKPIPTGTKKAEFAQAGYYDDETDGIHQALNEQQGVSRVLCFGYATNAIGKPFGGFAGAYAQKYARLTSRNGLHKANAAYEISGAADDGVILHELSEEAGDYDGTGADSHDTADETFIPAIAVTSSSVGNPSVITCSSPHGITTGEKVVIAGHAGSTPSLNGEQVATVISATTFSVPVNVTAGGTSGAVKRVATANGASGYLQVTAITLSGRPSVTIKIRHSADDATYADLITFTAVTARGAERKTVAGTVNRHLATSVTWGGAGGSPKVTYLVGLARS